MKTLVDHLAQYAAYHRDRRNILSHFIGIPMIVLSIAVLLASMLMWWVTAIDTPLPMATSPVPAAQPASTADSADQG